MLDFCSNKNLKTFQYVVFCLASHTSSTSCIAERLNKRQENEGLLGYDLYSSTLADVLSDPSLRLPIAVGLYAKWGSGKSFLLERLKGMYEHTIVGYFRAVLLLEAL